MADKSLSVSIKAGVEGAKSIEVLIDDLEEVSKVLDGQLKPAAQASARELRQLAQQDAAIEEFRALSAGVDKAKDALAAADDEAKAYTNQISAMGPPTAQEAAHQQRLQTSVSSAGAELQRQQQALVQAKSGLQGYGIAADQVQAAQVRIRQQVSQTRDALSELAPGYQRAGQSAQQSGRVMESAHRRVSEGVGSISQQLKNVQSAVLALGAGSQMVSMVRGLAETADAANNLRSRIELVTGAGQNFTAAWDGVQRVALATHSSLTDTGLLFTRVAQAGKDAGLSTQQATEQGLRLTETINQATQLSGASAQSSSAAITQLIQALQSGVLRGDEFNSMMEQAPRLASALATGLGVTTGELRKMAEAGSLSSQLVIAALQGQSDVVAREFEKLPPTVGRAMQDLSTQWMLYVDTVDKSTGASKNAAGLLQGLASNMQLVGDAAMSAGKGLLAFGALAAAQHMMSLATASAKATQEMAALGKVSVATAAQAEKAAVAGKRLATALAGLRTFGLLTIAMNFREIGTAIGEGAAKLMGYGQSFKKLEEDEMRYAAAQRNTALERERSLAWRQAEIDKQFELSKAARSSIAEFDKLSQEGVKAAEAIKKVSAAFDLSKIGGVRDFAATLDALAASGKISADELKRAWSTALDGKDLQLFEVQARTAFAGSAREAERLAQVMDATLREAVKRTGLDFEILKGNIGAASRSAINDVQVLIDKLDGLKAAGVDVGLVLGTSLANAIKSADSEAALAAIRGQIEQVRDSLGSKLADGLLDQAAQKANALRDKLDEARAGVDSLREAHKLLGLQSVDDLQRMASQAKSAYDTIKAAGAQEGESYEAWQARKTAAAQAYFEKLKAANGGVVTEAMKTQAAVEGVALAHDKAGASGVAATSNIASGWRNASAEAAEYQKQVSKQVDDINARHGQSAADYDRKYGKKEVKSQIDTKDRGSGPADNSGKYAAWRKFQTGKLSLEDEKLVDAVMQSAEANSDVASKYWHAFSLEGRASIDASYNQARQMKEEIERLKRDALAQKTAPQSALPAVGGFANTNAGTSQTFVSNVTIGGQTKQVSFADSSSQKVAEDLLRQLAAQKGVSSKN